MAPSTSPRSKTRRKQWAWKNCHSLIQCKYLSLHRWVYDVLWYKTSRRTYQKTWSMVKWFLSTHCQGVAQPMLFISRLNSSVWISTNCSLSLREGASNSSVKKLLVCLKATAMFFRNCSRKKWSRWLKPPTAFSKALSRPPPSLVALKYAEEFEVAQLTDCWILVSVSGGLLASPIELFGHKMARSTWCSSIGETVALEQHTTSRLRPGGEEKALEEKVKRGNSPFSPDCM